MNNCFAYITRRLVQPAIIVLLGISSQLAAHIIDSVAIVVDDQPILRSEFQQQLTENITDNPDSTTAEVFSQTVNQMVDTRIQLQAAERIGIRVTQEQIAAHLREIALREQLSIGELTQQLQAQFGSTARYRQKLEESLIIQQLQGAVIRNRIVITDTQVREFLATDSGRATARLLYSFLYIRLDAPNDATLQQVTTMVSSDTTTDALLAALADMDVFARNLD